MCHLCGERMSVTSDGVCGDCQRKYPSHKEQAAAGKRASDAACARCAVLEDLIAIAEQQHEEDRLMLDRVTGLAESGVRALFAMVKVKGDRDE